MEEGRSLNDIGVKVNFLNLLLQGAQRTVNLILGNWDNILKIANLVVEHHLALAQGAKIIPRADFHFPENTGPVIRVGVVQEILDDLVVGGHGQGMVDISEELVYLLLHGVDAGDQGIL